MTVSKQSFRGSCLCGGVQYKTDQVGEKMGHCHCSMCRKFHGAAFATFGSVPKANFDWLCGEELLQTFQAENGTKRTFCSRCGSSLIFQPSGNNEIVEFSLATLDVAPALKPDAHIYTSTKVDWIDISEDGLPKFLNGRC